MHGNFSLFTLIFFLLLSVFVGMIVGIIDIGKQNNKQKRGYKLKQLDLFSN